MTDGDIRGGETGAEKQPDPAANAHSPALLWRESRDELYAARAVLAELDTPARCAAVHLVRGWERIARLQAHAAETAPPAHEEIGAWLRETRLDFAEESDRERLAETLDALVALDASPGLEDEPEAPARGRIEESATALARALATADTALLDSAERATARRRWMIRGAVLATLALAAILYTAFWREEPTGPWYAEYSTRHIRGKPIVRRDDDVSFDWRVGPPVVDIGIDRFSATWYTCLALEAATKVTFELTSDDGSRLFVDGESTIDNWGVHTKKTEVATIELDGGVHALRVDYFDDHGEASIRLRAAFDDDPMGPIPTEMLIYPGTDFDREDPCAAERQDEDSSEDD